MEEILPNNTFLDFLEIFIQDSLVLHTIIWASKVVAQKIINLFSRGILA